MADKIKISELDFVFISYKEPNCEENFADLLSKVPWAKRVHGVKGFDSAHKAAAHKAETEFFISVDGDNIIDESFLLNILDWSVTDPKHVHRWRGKNSVNGLVYGNGGLVGWHKDTCLAMKTHENALDEQSKKDFCWTVPHANLHNCYSTTTQFSNMIPHSNLTKLTTWMAVGADVEYGRYAMLGARAGCYDQAIIDEPCHLDLDILEESFEFIHKSHLDKELVEYKGSIEQKLNLNVPELDASSSKFFKFTQPTHINRGVQDLEN